MKIVAEVITFAELRQIASGAFGNLVKAVVDVQREIVALDAELHADLEALLLQDGSRQEDLWGINFYPDELPENFIEYDSMINIRPSQNNRSRGVDDVALRDRIAHVVGMRISQ